jgi:hypothetical protein
MGRRFGPGIPIAISMVLIALSSYLFTNLSGNYNELLAPFILLGVGVGLQITMTAKVSVDDAGDAGEGVASGVYKASSMIGGSLGVAVLSAIFQNSAQLKFKDVLAPLKPSDEQLQKFLDVLTGATNKSDVSKLVIDLPKVITEVFTYALGNAMLLAAVVSILGAVACFLLMRGARADSPA